MSWRIDSTAWDMFLSEPSTVQILPGWLLESGTLGFSSFLKKLILVFVRCIIIFTFSPFRPISRETSSSGTIILIDSWVLLLPVSKSRSRSLSRYPRSRSPPLSPTLSYAYGDEDRLLGLSISLLNYSTRSKIIQAASVFWFSDPLMLSYAYASSRSDSLSLRILICAPRDFFAISCTCMPRIPIILLTILDGISM